MNETVFQVTLVFIPGLACAMIVDTLTLPRTQPTPLSTILRAFGFGLAAYFIYFLLYYLGFHSLYGVWPTVLDQIRVASIDSLRVIRPKDIPWATVTAVPFAVVWSLAANRKWFLRLMQRIRVTRRFGDESVWDFTFNLSAAAVEYVNLRDFETKAIYTGYVRAFSDGTEIRELLLERARVHDLDTGSLLYEMPLIYISRKRDTLHVEFPYTTQIAASAPVGAAPTGTNADTRKGHKDGEPVRQIENKRE